MDCCFLIYLLLIYWAFYTSYRQDPPKENSAMMARITMKLLIIAGMSIVFCVAKDVPMEKAKKPKMDPVP